MQPRDGWWRWRAGPHADHEGQVWWGAQRQLPRCRKCYIIPIRTWEQGSQCEAGTQDFNIKTGTAFFAQTLQDNGGSLLKTIGNYNGWDLGMTIVSM